MADLFPRLIAPVHPTASSITLSDVFDGLVHCPFCGNLPAYYEDLEFHPTPCEHLLAFWSDEQHQYVSPRLVEIIRAHGFQPNEDHQVCELGEHFVASWPFIFMAGIIPYSITFTQTFETAQDLSSIIVAYAPPVSLTIVP